MNPRPCGQSRPLGGGDRGQKKPRFRGRGRRGGRTTPSSPAPTLILSWCAHFLTTDATALSPRGLSFPSDGESLPAISSVGAGATLVCGAAVQESLQQARRQIWVLPFLPVKSLVQLFQNSIVV